MTRKEAGALGGLATVRKYGAGYMAKIGKKGAASLWARWQLLPYQTSKYQLVNRETGERIIR